MSKKPSSIFADENEAHSIQGLRARFTEPRSSGRPEFWSIENLRPMAMALIVSILAGAAAGLNYGGATGVHPAIEAGSRLDEAALSQALPHRVEVASSADAKPDVGRLLEEVRSLRAQVEQLRHGFESQNAAERLSALETAAGAHQQAAQALDRSTTALATKFDEISQRLARLEGANFDLTPVGSITRPRQRGGARTP